EGVRGGGQVAGVQRSVRVGAERRDGGLPAFQDLPRLPTAAVQVPPSLHESVFLLEFLQGVKELLAQTQPPLVKIQVNVFVLAVVRTPAGENTVSPCPLGVVNQVEQPQNDGQPVFKLPALLDPVVLLSPGLFVGGDRSAARPGGGFMSCQGPSSPPLYRPGSVSVHRTSSNQPPLAGRQRRLRRRGLLGGERRH